MENANNENKESKKEIQVITGNGKDLTISTVYEHIKNNTNIQDEKEEKKEIIIPKGSSDKNED